MPDEWGCVVNRYQKILRAIFSTEEWEIVLRDERFRKEFETMASVDDFERLAGYGDHLIMAEVLDTIGVAH